MLTHVNFVCIINLNIRETHEIMDVMKKKTYHFGNLKETLIEQGITLIHEEGIEKFSLRKLAKKVGVSATACYNHFENIDDLLQAMFTYVTDRFAYALRQAADNNPYHYVTLSIGVAYVEFFAEHPHYFNFLFDNEHLSILIKENELTCASPFAPLEIFIDATRKAMQANSSDESELRDNLLVMWATVHGLAAMANMKGIQHENKNWGTLTATLLQNKCWNINQI